MKTNSKLFASLAAAIVTCLLSAHEARAAATLIDVGTLNGNNNAYAFSISDSGRATGRSFSSGPSAPRCFRTLPNGTINETYDSFANVQAFLQSSFGSMYSTGYDIEQSGTGPVEVAGELMLYNMSATPRAFWYYEFAGSRSARLLSLGSQGTSNSAAALKQGPYGSVVVGHSWVNGLAQACLWALSGTNEWLYNYGGAYFSGVNSWATDTDMNRTIGYYLESNIRPRPFIVDGQTGPMWPLLVGGGGDGAYAFGMYTSGTTTYIVGYNFEFGNRRPVLWTYTGGGNNTLTPLGTYEDYDNGSALAINDAGQIVGSVWKTTPSYVEKACFWRVSGGGGLLNNQGTFDMDLVRAYKVTSGSTGSKVAGIGVKTGLSRGFILDHAD